MPHHVTIDFDDLPPMSETVNGQWPFDHQVAFSAAVMGILSASWFKALDLPMERAEHLARLFAIQALKGIRHAASTRGKGFTFNASNTPDAPHPKDPRVAFTEQDFEAMGLI